MLTCAASPISPVPVATTGTFSDAQVFHNGYMENNSNKKEDFTFSQRRLPASDSLERGRPVCYSS
jgi:hypothetical protein